MKDPWYPETNELKLWAYDENAMWPTQDFDLSIADLTLADSILNYGSDHNCPKKDFFVKCAYLIIGDAVRTEFNTESLNEVKVFLNNILYTNDSSFIILYERGKNLIANPEKFDYDLCCLGGFVDLDKKTS